MTKEGFDAYLKDRYEVRRSVGTTEKPVRTRPSIVAMQSSPEAS